MNSVFCSNEITIGFHPDGYRIDKTASPINRYTKWQFFNGQRWCNPKAVCFDSLPHNGWIKVDKFDWDNIDIEEKVSLMQE